MSASVLGELGRRSADILGLTLGRCGGITYLVETLVQLWDPSYSAFRIGNREMTVTIEDVAGLLNLFGHSTTVIFTLASGKAKFCHFTGLKESAL